MKKWIALLLSVVLVLGLLAGCTGKDDTGTQPSGDTAATGSTTGATEGVTEGTAPADAASGGDLVPELPATDGDMETEPELPASDGDLEG